jgi:hypothetical protein
MNNPQAFPYTEVSGDRSADSVYHKKGMTMLDYFAAKAMQSLIVQLTGKYLHQGEVNFDLPLNHIVNTSFEIAEAMLLEREKRMK